MGATNLRARNDLQLVTNHVKGNYQTKEPLISKYLQHILKMEKEFETFEIVHVLHDKNVRFGLTAKLASTKKLDHNKRVIQENFEVPSTKTKDMKVMMLGVNNVGQVTLNTRRGVNYVGLKNDVQRVSSRKQRKQNHNKEKS